jgi:ATP-dependent RNA helicase DeaD
MIVLDEADEMLNMGFKEDIETILLDTPEDRQTVLFSATMPPAILALTKQFQKDPQLIEIDKSRATTTDIVQSYVDVPHDRKKDALGALVQFHQPKRAIIFCNTKKMVDELTDFLCSRNLSAQSIHSDIKQDQRTAVMQGFKRGKTSILIATDIAARGIDVNDVDFVINYDIPPNTEYYIHRIGRTGRAGKSGRSITICSGKREVSTMRGIAYEIKSEIHRVELPTTSQIQKVSTDKSISEMEEALKIEALPSFLEMAEQLEAKGYTLKSIAAAAMQLHFKDENPPLNIPVVDNRIPEALVKVKKAPDKAKPRFAEYDTILINLGTCSRAAANHIIGAITERTELCGGDIGKIEIFADQAVVEIPSGRGAEIAAAMKGCKICGSPVFTTQLTGSIKSRRGDDRPAPQPYRGRDNKRPRRPSF